MLSAHSSCWAAPATSAFGASDAGGRLIDEPDEFTDRLHMGGRHVAAARADGVEHRCLFRSGDQKSDVTAAVDYRIGHGDADLGPSVRHSGDPALALVEN